MQHIHKLTLDTLVCHSFREANSFVDILANLRCEQDPTVVVIYYEQIRAQISSLFYANLIGITG